MRIALHFFFLLWLGNAAKIDKKMIRLGGTLNAYLLSLSQVCLSNERVLLWCCCELADTHIEEGPTLLMA